MAYGIPVQSHLSESKGEIEFVKLLRPNNPFYGDSYNEFDLFGKVRERAPLYDFVSEKDGFGHTVWIIEDDAEIAAIRKSFEAIPVSYIADGHHRSAAGARAALARKELDENHKGDEEYTRYLAILFPSTHLKILDCETLVTGHFWLIMQIASRLLFAFFHVIS